MHSCFGSSEIDGKGPAKLRIAVLTTCSGLLPSYLNIRPCVQHRVQPNGYRMLCHQRHVMPSSTTINRIPNALADLKRTCLVTLRSASIRTLEPSQHLAHRHPTKKPTLPTHRTQPLRSVLLNPGKKTMLPKQISFPDPSMPVSFMAYHMERMPAFANHSTMISFRLRRGNEGIHSVQSSPGYLHVGQVPSNCTLQIPQTSSSGMSHRQDATAFHSSMVTFMLRRAGGAAVMRGAGD